MVGLAFKDMVDAGVVPTGQGVLYLEHKNIKYVLDVMEDGRIRWCDDGEESVYFDSPRACYMEISNDFVARKRYYGEFHVLWKTGETRCLKDIKDAYTESKKRKAPSKQYDGVQEYNVAIPTWSERGPRSGVHGRERKSRVVSTWGMSGLVRPGKESLNPTVGEAQYLLKQEEYDEECMCAIEEEMTVCQPDGEKMSQLHESHAQSRTRMKVEPGMLDMDLNASEVVERIECCVEFIVSTLAMGQLPVFDSSSSLGSKASKKLFGIEPGQPSSLDRFAHFVSLLNTAHERLLCSNHRSTQRELYYMSKAKDPSLKAVQHADVLRNTCRVLKVPRYSLGIDCCSKGLIWGPLQIRFADSSMPSVDCSLLERGYPISGCVPMILKSTVRCSATCILVIEKESLFQRFAQHQQEMPQVLKDCLLVTAKGYPDIATRAFLRKLYDTYPSIPMVGMVDWNPHGVHILTQYRFGSDKSPESLEFALPDFRWLGLRMSTIKGLSAEGGLQEMSKRDYSLSKGLLEALQGLGADKWVQELECMSMAGVKADFESLYDMVPMECICHIFSTMIQREEWI